MVTKQIASTMNAVFPNITAVNEDGTLNKLVLAEDISNIVDFAKAVDAQTTIGNDFNQYFTKIVDKIGYTVFIDDAEDDDDEFELMKIAFDSGSIVETIMFSDGDFVDNTAWDNIVSGSHTAAPTFDEMFGLHKPEVKASYTNGQVTLATEVYTVTYKQWKSACTSPAAFVRFAEAIANRWRAKIKQLRMKLKRMQVAAWACEKKLAKNGVLNLLEMYKADFPAATTTAATALRDKEFLRYAKIKIDTISKVLNNRNGIYNPSHFINPVPRKRMKFLMYAPMASGLRSYLYADTYHEDYVKLDGYSEVTTWQAIGDGLTDVTKMQITAKTASSPNKAVYLDHVVGVIFDERAIYQVNDEPRTAVQRNDFADWNNYQNQLTVGCYSTLDLNGVVLTISDYAIDYDSSTATSAPSNWSTIKSTLYKESNGTYSANGDAAWSKGTIYYKKVA